MLTCQSVSLKEGTFLRVCQEAIDLNIFSMTVNLAAWGRSPQKKSWSVGRTYPSSPDGTLAGLTGGQLQDDEGKLRTNIESTTTTSTLTSHTTHTPCSLEALVPACAAFFPRSLLPLSAHGHSLWGRRPRALLELLRSPTSRLTVLPASTRSRRASATGWRLPRSERNRKKVRYISFREQALRLQGACNTGARRSSREFHESHETTVADMVD